MIDVKLYLITDRSQTRGRAVTDVVRGALEGGVRSVQLREKDLSGADLYRLAREMRHITSDFGASLIINDRIDIALAVGADGVHVGVNSLPVTAVRRILGNKMFLFYSAHSVEEALQVQRDGADAITFGPVFHTPSKVAYGAPCGISLLESAVAALDIPVVALGGVSEENVRDILPARVKGVAVISAIMAAADSRAAAESLLKKIDEHVSHP